MVGFGTILGAVLPVFLLIFIGWLMRRLDVLTSEGEKNLVRLVVNLLYPAFVFHFVLGNPLLREPRIVLEAGLTGYVVIALGCFTAFFLAPLLGIRDAIRRRSFAVATGVFNFGYVALPVARLFFDDETIGVMLVVNVGVDLAIWTVGVSLLAGRLDKSVFRLALNPPVIALILAIILNSIGFDQYCPDFVRATIGMIAPCAIPIGLLMIGTAFYSLTGDLKRIPQWQIPVGSTLIRLGLIPILMLTLAKFLPLADTVKAVVVIHAAMPSAVFPIVLAKYYSGDPLTSIQSIVPNCILCLLTIPLWVSFGFRWLGLN